MEPRLGRLAVLLAVGGADRRRLRQSTTSASPAAPSRQRGRLRVGGGLRSRGRIRASRARRRSRRRCRPTTRRPSPATSSIRWYLLPRHRRRARAGRGRAQGRRRLQRLAPGHPPAVRGLRLRRARATRLSVQLGVRQRPRHRRPGRHRRRRTRSTASGSTCSRSSTRTSIDMSQYPESHRRPVQRRRRGPGRHPVRDLSVGPVLQGRACSRRPGSTSRRTSGTATYTMPDGSRRPVGLRHRHARSPRS